MVAEVARVVAGTIEEDGFAAAEELHAHQVHAGRVDDAAVVTDLSLAVETAAILSSPDPSNQHPDPA